MTFITWHIFINLKRNILISPTPDVANFLCSVVVCDMYDSYTWNHTLCDLPCLVLSTEHDYHSSSMLEHVLMNSISLCGQSMFYLGGHPLSIATASACCQQSTLIGQVKVFVRVYVYSFLRICIGKVAWSYGDLTFNCLRNCQTFFQIGSAILYSYQCNMRVLTSP